MDRRKFCHRMATLGGVLALAPLLEACGPPATPESSPQPPSATGSPEPQATPTPTATPAPTATLDPAMAAVALVRTTDRAEGVLRAIELLGIDSVGGKRVLLKPNFNSADEAPGSTHPDVLRTLVSSLNNMGARSITVGDRSGMGDTRQVMEDIGVFELGEELGFETLVFDELGQSEWEMIDRDDFHWAIGFPVPRMLLEAECVVQTCNLKTHAYGGHFTLSLKNSVGFVAKLHGGRDFMSQLHRTDDQRRMIAEINAAYEPALIVVDGVEAFVDGGPDVGTRAATEVVLAGTDRVAIDAIGVAILRLFGTTRAVSRGRVFEQEQIARAVELGLGVDAPEKIAFVTGDAESEAYAAQIRDVLLA